LNLDDDAVHPLPDCSELDQIKKGVSSAVGFLHCAGSGEGLF